MKRSFLLAAAVLMLAVGFQSCGGGSSSSSNSGSEYSSSESLSRYAGKWELFQVGNGPGESATFTLKISSNGNASISHYARTGYTDTCLESGDGYAELNGDVLFVEITSGKSRGTTLRLIARDGRIYTADGEAFSKR
ncbi:MAG: hypothetical protein K2K98_11060 [Muribaculaceae bacterium]|nr:hypothetical protein [Muribaculaceae bacterium]